MAAIVEPGQGIGERELLQLTVTLLFPQARDHGIERPGQVPDLAAAAGGKLDSKVSSRHARRGFGETLERPCDEHADDERQQPHRREQRRHQQHRPKPQHPRLAHRFGTRGFGNRRPAQLGNPPQHRDDLTSRGPRLNDGLTLALDQVSGRRWRDRRLHQVCGVPSGADHDAPRLGDQIEVSRVVGGQLLQHVSDAIQIDLRAQRAEKQAVILTDGHDQNHRRFAKPGIPERFTRERVPGAQRVQLVGRQSEPRPAAAARQDQTVPPDDRESLVLRKVLTDGIEVVAEARDGLRGITTRDPGEIVGHHVGTRAQAQIVQALVEPYTHLASRIRARAAQLLTGAIAQRASIPSVQHQGHDERREQRR